MFFCKYSTTAKATAFSDGGHIVTPPPDSHGNKVWPVNQPHRRTAQARPDNVELAQAKWISGLIISTIRTEPQWPNYSHNCTLTVGTYQLGLMNPGLKSAVANIQIMEVTPTSLAP